VRIGVTDSAGQCEPRGGGAVRHGSAEQPNPVSFRLCFVRRVLRWHRRPAECPGPHRYYAAAIEYSDRALTILREALGNDRSALAPFLDDNRMIKDKLASK
jgi:hypothetical protein